jgi:predicted amidophosphoribosyltransferase
MNCPVCDAPDVKIIEDYFECSYCGSTLPHNMSICPSCQSPNPLEAEACEVCGEPLTLFSQVIIRHANADSGPYRLRQAREQAARIKESEERASQQRLHDLEETDRRRIQAALEAERARRKEQSQLMKISAAIVILFLLLILFLALRSALGL